MQIDRQISERRKKQKKRHIYIFAVVAFLAVYFIFLGVFELIVRLPAFQAEQITIQGNNQVSDTQIMDLLQAVMINRGDTLGGGHDGWKAMLGFNNMLIWPDALPSTTVEAIPQLAGVTISKNYFLHTITVTVTERQPFAVWCLVSNDDATMPSDSCSWFDDQGIVFEPTLDTQGNAIFVVHDYAQSKITLNQPVLPAPFLPNLISIINVLKSSGLNIEEIALNDLSLEQIDVTTADSNGNPGAKIYFSLRFSAAEDLPVLQSLIANPGIDKLQYIDFTVQNRAYYK